MALPEPPGVCPVRLSLHCESCLVREPLTISLPVTLWISFMVCLEPWVLVKEGVVPASGGCAGPTRLWLYDSRREMCQTLSTQGLSISEVRGVSKW